MSVAPTPNPAAVAQETRRARLAVLAVTVGIAAMIFAYAIAPGVRHAVSHAAHSVQHTFSHAVTHVFDPHGTEAELDDAGRGSSSHAHRRAPAHRASHGSRARAARKAASP
jgi:hypothetical protein